MLKDSININNCNWNSVALKKKSETFENYHFLAQLSQCWCPHGPRPKQKTIYLFFAEITIPDHKVPKTFYFSKILYALAELLFFYFA